jgi:Ser/Thr protein kinase RdoA (MazF antagonist)
MTLAGALTNALHTASAGPLVAELFGDGEPSEAAPFHAAAEAMVEAVAPFGRPLAVTMVRASSGIVVGFDLADCRRIVLKVHRGHSGARLTGVLRAQRVLRMAGLPVADPLTVAPIPVGTGWAVLETWLEVGTSLDVRPPPLRRALAVALHDIVQALDAETLADLRPAWTGPYPPAHSPIFDFVATAAGAEWIDELNSRSLAAKAVLTADGVGRLVVSHGDLRPENVLVNEAPTPRVTSIYDLDSLIADAEPWIVGGVARAFSTNWSTADPMLPTIDEMLGFLGDYEAVRAMPFTADERALAHAGTLHALAYSARCEHALFPDGSAAPWGPGWRSLLRRWAQTT